MLLIVNLLHPYYLIKIYLELIFFVLFLVISTMKLTNFFTKSFLILIIIFLSEINGMKNNSNKSLKKRSKHTEENFVFKKLNFEGESSNIQNPKSN